MTSKLDLIDIPVNFSIGSVPVAVLSPMQPPADASMPLCLLLHSGNQSRDTLVELKPLLDLWWEQQLIPPQVFATPSTGPMSFYFDNPKTGELWESFVANQLGAELRNRYPAIDSRTVLAGFSMGGCGALKIAFANPDRFAAVAALEPMIEPGLHSNEVSARNRYYYMGGGPDILLGSSRDPEIFEENNPANRAVRRVAEIRASCLPIYLEAGDEDALLAHDGAEFLHRVLWELDIPHEYRLLRGADHVGPSIIPRLRSALGWLGEKLSPAEPSPMDESERAWSQWLDAGAKGAPPEIRLNPATRTMQRVLAQQVSSRRAAAQAADPMTARRYGVLPEIL